MQVVSNHVTSSVAPSGLLWLLHYYYRGLAPPSVVFRPYGTLEYARFDCSPLGKQKDRHISGGDQDLPRTAVTPLRVLETHPQRWGFTLRGA